MKVCIGGTFNILHKGHKYLIDKAFETAGKQGFVLIGITVGKILKNKSFIKPIGERIDIIKKYLIEKGYDKNSKIIIIKDEFGPSSTGNYDAIVVSPETLKNAEKINNIRSRNNLKPLKIIKINYILADDSKPISSTRIYKNEIDKNGKIKSKLN